MEATNQVWAIDPMHSEIQFKVKHLVISTVTGQFNTFSGQVTADGEDFDGAEVSFEADIDSIDTNNEQRDQHLKSADFFDAANHPKMTYKGKLEKNGEDSYLLNGEMNIRGHAKPVALEVSFGGQMVDPYGNEKAGFEISGKINRKEFGLAWSAVTEAGGVVVADEVKLLLNVQLGKQA